MLTAIALKLNKIGPINLVVHVDIFTCFALFLMGIDCNSYMHDYRQKPMECKTRQSYRRKNSYILL